jgi:serine/threonine protein phosphatase PrpC
MSGGGHPGFKVRAVSTFSSKGARPAQEDHVLSLQEKGIFVIADGFGGPGPGAQAAKLACEAVRGFLFKEAGDLEATLPFVLRSYFSLAGNVLFNALIHANHKVRGLNRGKGIHERGGASVLAGFLDGDLLALANVGGCTAWLVRGGKSTELVTPRTYGRLCDPFQGEEREDLRVPLMAVGMADDLEPEILEYRVRPDDWLILHTDGVSAEVREKIVALQGRHSSPHAANEEAISVLNQCRFNDNASLSLIVF